MSNAQSTHDKLMSAVEQIAAEVVAPSASVIDQTGTFPQGTIDAFAKAGILGATSGADVGGLGLGLRSAAAAVERVARECPSTAMILTMHYSAVAVLEKLGDATLRTSAAKDRLLTLAFSEAGSRSHFWAPTSTAKPDGKGVRLDAKKSWATSANHADYVWSSKPLAADGASTLWFVPRATAGITRGGAFDGLGLRGNDSTSITAAGAIVPESARLGADGEGFKTMMEIVLPTFQVLVSACSVGLMEGAVGRAATHCSSTSFEHLGSSLRELPTIRAYLARMRVQTDMAKALLGDTISALESGRADAMLRVLEVKAAAGESASIVTELAMRVCGGAAFRKEVGVERLFRDARAANVMAPTTDVLYDFIGKAVTGMDLF